MCNRNMYLEMVNRKPGTFVRVIYKSDLKKKLKADAVHDGYTVEKITETTGRVGCNYNHMANVIKRKANSTPNDKNYTDPYEWVVSNRIKRHKGNGTEYLVMGTTPNSNTRTKFIITHGSDVTVVDKLTEDMMDILFTPSEKKKLTEGFKPDVLSIKLDNVISFNGVS